MIFKINRIDYGKVSILSRSVKLKSEEMRLDLDVRMLSIGAYNIIYQIEG